MTFYKIIACALIQLISASSFGQVQDTIIKADSVRVIGKTTAPVKDSVRLAIEAMPRKAAIRSAILPGLGQYYNGRLWWIKVPVIYGGFGALVGIYMWNQDNYKLFLGEAQYRQANNRAPRDPRFAAYDYEAIVKIKDLYRRDRDLTLIGMVGWYGINIIEAYVDAKFFRFDISEDLSLKITPSVQKNALSYSTISGAPGLKLTLAFRKNTAQTRGIVLPATNKSY